MGEQTPNIHVVESVWHRLKKAKIRDLQPIKDVKGGADGKGTSNPPQAARATREKAAAVKNLGLGSGGDCSGFAALPADGKVISKRAASQSKTVETPATKKLAHRRYLQ